MPQSPIAVFSQYPGGNSSSLNVTAAKVVKSSPGTLYRIVVQTVPSAGNLTVNDNNSTSSGNTAATQLLNVAFGSLTAGQVITLEAPCATGITVSSVGTGGVYAVFYS